MEVAHTHPEQFHTAHFSFDRIFCQLIGKTTCGVLGDSNAFEYSCGVDAGENS